MNWYKNKYLKKMFLETTEWNAAWKLSSMNEYAIIPNPDGYWLADTLLFSKDDVVYLFVEAYEKETNKGRIGVMVFNGSRFCDFRVILKKDYHLSYPFVFEFKGDVYMIPESSQNNTIEIYKASALPDKWEFVCKLMDGNYVDTTLYRFSESEFTFYTYDMSNNTMCTGTLNMDDRVMEIDSIVPDDNYVKRAGGSIFKMSDKFVRPLQYNKYFYGQRLSFVDCETELEYQTLKPEEIENADSRIFRRIHTYSRVKDFEAVDLSSYKFCISKPIKKIWAILYGENT